MKKLLALLLVGAMSLSMVACGGSSETATTEETAAEYKVAMVINSSVSDGGW